MTTSHVRMHVYSYTMQGQYYSAPYLQAFLSRSPHLSAENKHTTHHTASGNKQCNKLLLLYKVIYILNWLILYMQPIL